MLSVTDLVELPPSMQRSTRRTHSGSRTSLHLEVRQHSFTRSINVRRSIVSNAEDPFACLRRFVTGQIYGSLWIWARLRLEWCSDMDMTGVPPISGSTVTSARSGTPAVG